MIAIRFEGKEIGAMDLPEADRESLAPVLAEAGYAMPRAHQIGDSCPIDAEPAPGQPRSCDVNVAIYYLYEMIESEGLTPPPALEDIAANGWDTPEQVYQAVAELEAAVPENLRPEVAEVISYLRDPSGKPAESSPDMLPSG